MPLLCKFIDEVCANAPIHIRVPTDFYLHFEYFQLPGCTCGASVDYSLSNEMRKVRHSAIFSCEFAKSWIKMRNLISISIYPMRRVRYKERAQISRNMFIKKKILLTFSILPICWLHFRRFGGLQSIQPDDEYSLSLNLF